MDVQPRRCFGVGRFNNKTAVAIISPVASSKVHPVCLGITRYPRSARRPNYADTERVQPR
jgi:hypothetical protein